MSKPIHYRIEIRKPALKVLSRLPANLALRINDAIDGLADNPRPQGYKRLRGHDLYRIRVGDWRIAYAIEDDQLLILIVEVAPRGGAYRRL